MFFLHIFSVFKALIFCLAKDDNWCIFPQCHSTFSMNNQNTKQHKSHLPTSIGQNIETQPSLAESRLRKALDIITNKKGALKQITRRIHKLKPKIISPTNYCMPKSQNPKPNQVSWIMSMFKYSSATAM